MYKMLIYIVSFRIILFGIGYYFSINPNHKIVLEKNGITIYDLDTSENKNKFKAVYTINTNIDHFTSLVLDPKNHEKWVNSIQRAENIGNMNDSIYYTYLILSVESIFKKEAVVRTTVKNDPGRHYASIIQEVDTSIVYDSKYKRLKSFTAEWKMHEINPNKLEVELYFIGDKDDYPEFVHNLLRSIFVKKLYKLAYRSREQANNRY